MYQQSSITVHGFIMNHHALVALLVSGHVMNIKLNSMLTCNFFLHVNIESFE